MFGYVIPQKSELKVREYEVFRAYYCGLCKEIGKKSQVARMALTFDMTFLGILLSSIYLENELCVKKFCAFKMKKVMVITDNAYMEYAGDMNTILSNRKLLDDYNDDRNFFSLLLSKIINTKSLSILSMDKLIKIDYNLKELNNLEKLKCNSIDETGHCFASLTSEIFKINEDKQGRVLSLLGYNVGKWIYTIDAFDDLLEDINKQKYNPLIHTFNYSGGNAEDFKKAIRDNMEFTLVKCLDEVGKAFELLQIKKNKAIIENIIYMGMKQKTDIVLRGRCKNDQSIRDLRGKGRCY